MAINFLKIEEFASGLGVPLSGTVKPAQGDAVNTNSSGEGVLAQNTAGANKIAHGLAGQSGTQNGLRISLVRRAYCEDTGASFTQGGDLWLGTNGKLTQTKPSASTKLVQHMGHAINATEFYLDVSGYTEQNA